jgi:phosphoglycerate dehydrogenase-like enzyme
MKIFLETSMVTHRHADRLRNAFPDVAFTESEDDCRDVDAVFCHPRYAVKKNLDLYPSLTWVQVLMAGFDAADTSELKRRQILLTNMRNVFDIAVAEDVFAKILMLNRAVRHDLQMMESGRWEPVRHLHEIHGSTVGIIGAGSIGSAIAMRMKAFGATVVGYRRKSATTSGFDEIVTEREGLLSLCSVADYVIACLPKNPDTVRIIDSACFAAMKPDAVFVNVGRGETVDQDALVDVLRKGGLRGAALDVTVPEPLPPDHPLWRLDNVFITPHNASSSPFLWERISGVLEENIRRRLAGTVLLNIVEDMEEVSAAGK